MKTRAWIPTIVCACVLVGALTAAIVANVQHTSATHEFIGKEGISLKRDTIIGRGFISTEATTELVWYRYDYSAHLGLLDGPEGYTFSLCGSVPRNLSVFLTKGKHIEEPYTHLTNSSFSDNCFYWNMDSGCRSISTYIGLQSQDSQPKKVNLEAGQLLKEGSCSSPESPLKYMVLWLVSFVMFLLTACTACVSVMLKHASKPTKHSEQYLPLMTSD